MRALHVENAGEQPTIGELPVAEVRPDTVLIKVKAAALNPIDNVLAGGYMSGMLPHEYPLTLGRDAAGVVEAVGDGVTHVAVGDEVIGHVLLAPPIKHGTLAEYALLPAASVVAKPAGLDWVKAAALPLAAAGAVAAVNAIDPQPGQTVLVNGASGGIGSYAIQLLKARGVTVIATGSDAARLTALGADKVVDRAAGSVAAQAGKVDALINLTVEDVPLSAVTPGGKVATLAMAPDADAIAAAGLTGGSVMATPTADVVGPLAAQAADGTLTVDVTSVVPLEQATEALAAIAAGKGRGKVVVTL